MKAQIVQIGNSRGLRIPKPVLEQCRFETEVELEVHDGRLIVSCSRPPRDGWGKVFEAMASYGDDELIDGEQPATSWEEEVWEW